MSISDDDIISDLTKKLFPSQNNFEKSIKLEKYDENLGNNYNNDYDNILNKNYNNNYKVLYNNYDNISNKNCNNINNNDNKNNNKKNKTKIYTNINNSKMIYYKPKINNEDSIKNNDLIYVNPSLLKNKSDMIIDIDVLEKEVKSNNNKKKLLIYDIKIKQILNLEKYNDYYKKFENI